MMSGAGSLSSLDTVFGSCEGSDLDSLHHFQSIRSDSTSFYSVNENDVSDTETLVDPLEDQIFHEASSSLTLRSLEDHDSTISSTVVASGTQHLSQDELLNGTCESDGSTRSLCRLSGSSEATSLEKTILSQGVAFNYTPIITQICVLRPSSTSSIPQDRVNGVKTISLFILMYLSSLGSQVILRFYPYINCWILVFWRALLQLLCSSFLLLFKRQSLIGPPGKRLQLCILTCLTSVSLFAMLFSSQRLAVPDLAAIFWCVPIACLVGEHILKRGALKALNCAAVVVIWLGGILLLSHRLPWASLVVSTSANSSKPVDSIPMSTVSANDKWYPPLFGLDTLNSWPVQPSAFAIFGTNQTEPNNWQTFHAVSGLLVALFGIAFDTGAGLLTSLSPPELLAPILFWQAAGAALVATTGLLIMGHTFIIVDLVSWLYVGASFSLGFAANLLTVYLLTMECPTTSRNGWPVVSVNRLNTLTKVLTCRGALEMAFIYCINTGLINKQAYPIEEAVGLGLITTIGIYLAAVKTQIHNSVT